MDQDQQKIEKARMRVATMLSMADVLGSEIGPAEIRKAALAPLSPTSERAAALLARLIIANSESVAVIFAGLVDDEILAKLHAGMDLDGHTTPDARWLPDRPVAAT